MDKELIDITLKIIHVMEKYTSSPSGLSWRQANHASNLYNLAVTPREPLSMALFNLRLEYLGDKGKELKLKDDTTLLEIFEYVTKKQPGKGESNGKNT